MGKRRGWGTGTEWMSAVQSPEPQCRGHRKKNAGLLGVVGVSEENVDLGLSCDGAAIVPAAAAVSTWLKEVVKDEDGV